MRYAIIPLALGVLFAVGAASASPASYPQLMKVDPVLGVHAAPAALAMLPEWRRVLDRHQKQIARLDRQCADGECPAWAKAVKDFSYLNTPALILQVHRFVNRTRYRSDPRGDGGSSDTWSTPTELFANGGDCEDFAIAKFLLLSELGVPPERMRILVLKDGPKDGHAVLLVRTDNQALVLDNRAASPYRYTNRSLAVLAYAFDGQSMWIPLRPPTGF